MAYISQNSSEQYRTLLQPQMTSWLTWFIYLAINTLTINASDFLVPDCLKSWKSSSTVYPWLSTEWSGSHRKRTLHLLENR